MDSANLPIYPETAAVNRLGHLTIGGCDTFDLATSYGTPLYVFDEVTLRNRCREFRHEFGRLYPSLLVIYACKAYTNLTFVKILAEEGLGLDVVSGGELSIARSAGFPLDKVYFHGNNKTREELEMALRMGIGRVVVDNFREMALLNDLASEQGKIQEILLRLSPEVDPHTHTYTTTGVLDSKFGFPLSTGQAEQAIARARECSNLRLVGLHFHLGSPLFEHEPYILAINTVLEFAARMVAKHELSLEEFDVGGGFPIQYVAEKPAPPVEVYAQAIATTTLDACKRLGLPLPRLIIEPGRSIVGRAGVALYRVGGSKTIPNLRKYVFVDGGMGDNIRPALYGATYEAMAANKAKEPRSEVVTVAGKFCESGDILLRDVSLPPLEDGDIIAIPASGAYCLAMSSNYNAYLKPAVILVKDGRATIVRRRETYADLIQYDAAA